MPLFDVAVIQHPSNEEVEKGKAEILVVPPMSVVAKDAQTAALLAVMDGAREKLDKVEDKSRLEVLVRPFVG